MRNAPTVVPVRACPDCVSVGCVSAASVRINSRYDGWFPAPKSRPYDLQRPTTHRWPLEAWMMPIDFGHPYISRPVAIDIGLSTQMYDVNIQKFSAFFSAPEPGHLHDWNPHREPAPR